MTPAHIVCPGRQLSTGLLVMLKQQFSVDSTHVFGIITNYFVIIYMKTTNRFLRDVDALMNESLSLSVSDVRNCFCVDVGQWTCTSLSNFDRRLALLTAHSTQATTRLQLT